MSGLQMNRLSGVRGSPWRVACTLVAATTLFALGTAHAATPFTGIMPRADCGPNDRVETGLQGQTTIAA